MRFLYRPDYRIRTAVKDDIIELTLAGGIVLAPIVAQVAAPPESLVSVVSQITGFGLCAVLLLYINFYKDPREAKERREERTEMLAAFKSERAEIIANFLKQNEEKRKDYLADVASARQEFLSQLTEERNAFEQMLARLTKETK